MFKKEFHFGTSSSLTSLPVTPDTLFHFDTGYGFLTEDNCSENELLQIPELNHGFEPWYWYIGHKLIELSQDPSGCLLQSKEYLPLSFKATVPSNGNYKVTITICAEETPLTNLFIFTGRRRLVLKDKTIEAHEQFTFETIVNVCDFIPRGREIPFTDHSVCITVLGDTPKLSSIIIEEIDVPTLFIAGDSTLTDQTGAYPYIPECSYCGWAQFLPYFLNNTAAVSNHAHSGLTTETFRKEGHYGIIERNIKAGDFFLLQFGHNDQKLSHLTSDGGYRENVLAYIDEIRSYHATPILVTPLCRNSWKGTDGTYNDLLIEYAEQIKAIGMEQQVPVLDLHQDSYDFITTIGLEAGKSYFYPGDFTHTNDYGAYKMASFISKEFLSVADLKEFVDNEKTDWIPPTKIELPKPPKGFEHVVPPVVASCQVTFTDIDNCENKEKITELTSIGVIPNTEELFRPNDFLTRAEAVAMVIKVSNFFPTNVYNDMFEDVVGHEWYAGTVECAWTNGIVDSALVDKNFYPNQFVTYEELISFIINGYKSRKTLPEIQEEKHFSCSSWANAYYQAADSIHILDSTISSSRQLTRQEAVEFIYIFKKAM